MWIQRAIAFAIVLGCVSVLLSMGCGLLTLPVDGPKALITNAQHLKFTVNLVDDYNVPVDGVSVTVIQYALDADLVFGETGATKKLPQRTVSKQFSYDGFGKYGVQVTYEKAGYTPASCIYFNDDKTGIASNVYGFGTAPIEFPRQPPVRINVRKQPVSTVILFKH